MVSGTHAITLRLPRDLHDWLKAEAANDFNRPVSNLILSLLGKCRDASPRKAAAPVFTSVPHTLPPAKLPTPKPQVDRAADEARIKAEVDAMWGNDPEPARAPPEITIRTPDDYDEAERERIVADFIARSAEEDGE